MLTFAAAARQSTFSGAPAPPQITVLADEVLLGVDSSVAVPVSVQRLNCAATLALSVSGLPADVSAEFSPAVLGPAETTSTLTLTSTVLVDEGVSALSILAAGGGVSDSVGCSLTVTNASGILTSITARRFDGSDDETLVSSAIPLHATQLHASDLSKVALFIGETQYPCYVAACGRAYADGYVRSLLVQSIETFDASAQIAATLRLVDAEDVLPRLSAATPLAYPDAMWLTSAPQLTSAIGTFGLLAPASAWDTDACPDVAYWLSQYSLYYAKHSVAWARDFASYGYGFTALSMYACTGTLGMLRKGLESAKSYYDNYYSNKAGINEWHRDALSAYAAYLLTGAPEYLDSLRIQVGDAAHHRQFEANPLAKGGERRPRAHRLTTYVCAYLAGIDTASPAYAVPNSTQPNVSLTAGFVQTRIEQERDSAQASGLYTFTDGPPIAAKWYMSHMFVSAMAWVRDVFPGVADIPDALAAYLDAAWPERKAAGWTYTTPMINPYPETPPYYWTDNTGADPDSVGGPTFGMMAYLAFAQAARALGGTEEATLIAQAETVLAETKAIATLIRDRALTQDEHTWFFAQGASAHVGTESLP